MLRHAQSTRTQPCDTARSKLKPTSLARADNAQVVAINEDYIGLSNKEFMDATHFRNGSTRAPRVVRAAVSTLVLIAAMFASWFTASVIAETTSPPNARVYFIWPTDGTVIRGGRFWLRMGLRNMGVAPKGVHMQNTGHHHLIIDAPLTAPGEPIPSDRNHLHFGAGETEARIELPLGAHTLQLLLGDEDHMAHRPPVRSEPISIVVVR